MVRTLMRANAEIFVVDNLQAGHRDTIPKGVTFLEIDVRAKEELARFFRAERIEAVFHFASRIQVGESVVAPRLYYRDNLSAAVDLLDAVLDAGISRFILSSTAAVYGNPARVPIREEDPTNPVNPYGQTKLAIEHMLEDYARAYGLRYAALRYFNAAGAEPNSGLGERHDPETHLIPLVLEAALGLRPEITIFGQDYPTPDGTCIRDYIHVMDLADAHLAALDHLIRGGDVGAFNLGTGQGHSVREVIDTAKRVTEVDIPLKYGPRREGDPAILVASSERAQRTFNWKPVRSSLETIIRDAWEWHRYHAEQAFAHAPALSQAVGGKAH
jgi:UDP-glucose 4-epimerase